MGHLLTDRSQCPQSVFQGRKWWLVVAGSMRDDIVTEAAAKAGITLYLTARHFAH
jgi:AICAR transformylase/IMP cyclohydrolase PurH